MAYRWQPKCCICGQFVPYDADQSTAFGDSHDYEPPEPDYYCNNCIAKEKVYCRKTDWVPTSWIPANWEIEIAEELGFGRAGPKGCAWSRWYKKEQPLPEDYVWHNE